jgi:hypothetical protein
MDVRRVSLGRHNDHPVQRRQLRSDCVECVNAPYATIRCGWCFSREVPCRSGFWRYLQGGPIVCRKCAGCGYPKRSRPLSGGRGSIGAWRQLQCGHAVCGITPVVALECVLWPLSGGRQAGSVQLRQLSCSHAECESHACCGSDACCTSLGGMRGGPGYWRQLRYSHFVCGNHACRGAWVRAVVAFGGR